MAKYNMTFEEAQDYISRRGFDIPWNDCDVFVDDRYITQTVANVLKWADDNPNKHTSDTDAFMKKAKEGFCKAMCQGKPPRSTCTSLGTCKEYDTFVNYMKGE